MSEKIILTVAGEYGTDEIVAALQEAMKKLGVEKIGYTLRPVPENSQDVLSGKVIVASGVPNLEIYELLGWSPIDHPIPLVMHMDDGTMLVPSSDVEGNRPGVVYQVQAQKVFVLLPQRKDG